MGIINLARNAFKAALATYKATVPTPGRNHVRRFVAALSNACNEWLAKHDAQEATAPQQFAESRTTQYATFIATLPDVTIGPDPVEDP